MDDDETSPSLIPMPELARLAAMTAEQLAAHKSAVASRFQTVVQLFDSQETAWPTKTDEMCRWCMHRFDWFPLGIPVRFDEQRHKMVRPRAAMLLTARSNGTPPRSARRRLGPERLLLLVCMCARTHLREQASFLLYRLCDVAGMASEAGVWPAAHQSGATTRASQPHDY
jgi:hypothetical protein